MAEIIVRIHRYFQQCSFNYAEPQFLQPITGTFPSVNTKAVYLSVIVKGKSKALYTCGSFSPSPHCFTVVV